MRPTIINVLFFAILGVLCSRFAYLVLQIATRVWEEQNSQPAYPYPADYWETEKMWAEHLEKLAVQDSEPQQAQPAGGQRRCEPKPGVPGSLYDLAHDRVYDYFYDSLYKRIEEYRLAAQAEVDAYDRFLEVAPEDRRRKAGHERKVARKDDGEGKEGPAEQSEKPRDHHPVRNE